MQRRNKPTQTHFDPALSLVECSVRVSPTLARLMRKCATLEAGGTSAHDALLASAGFQAGEIEALRTRAKQSEDELKQARDPAALAAVTLVFDVQEPLQRVRLRSFVAGQPSYVSFFFLLKDPVTGLPATPDEEAGLDFSTAQLGIPLAPGTYTNAQRAAFEL